MNKIPSVFMRNPDNMRELTQTPHPDALWVIAGEGVATRKYDGTCVMLDEDVRWWGRREVKPGKNTPAGWIPVEKDDITGKIMGWEPIEQTPFAQIFVHAIRPGLTPGTYELCGPKINGNPENLVSPTLFKHSAAETVNVLAPVPYSYDNLKEFILWVHDWLHWEGVVWHHPDGRMAKLKGRDFIK